MAEETPVTTYQGLRPQYRRTSDGIIEKLCRLCSEYKDLTQYYNRTKGSADGKHAYCKSCCKNQNKLDYQTGGRSRFIERRFGITEQEYDDLLEEQNGRCAICERTAGEVGGRNAFLAVDHDHVTGRIRGLLCSNCNTAIGLLRDDSSALVRAIHYLEG